MRSKEKREPESIIREIKRKTRRKFTSEEKIRIVLEGLQGESSIADVCRRVGIHPLECRGSCYFNINNPGILDGRICRYCC